MKTTQINLKTITFFLTLIIMSFLCFKNCSDKSRFEVQNSKYEKSNDSLRILEQKGILKIEAYDRRLKELSSELLIAQNNSQISETKYYALKNKTIKPKYIENVVDCNDTIQSIYKYAVAKDSLCNIAIIDKNKAIQKQDTIIKINVLEKQEYNGLLILKNNANTNLESIIKNDKKEISNQKLNKNIWKLTSVGLAGIILKLVIFK
jgi:hypothetical protein